MDIHRIGGASIENLRLKPAEETLQPPGISVLRSPSATEAAAQIRAAFPGALALHEAARTIASTTEQLIQKAGFILLPNPTRKLPNHCRIIHPEGIAGFRDENLAKLVQVFSQSSGH